jgi:segregation and condensation protein B
MTMERNQLIRLLEALLFASSDPVTERDLAKWLPEDANPKELLKELQGVYANRGVQLVRVGNAWAFRTAPDLAEHLRVEKETLKKLSRAAVETLAIIAYHQPVTRAEIEEIRGVGQSKGTLDTLLELGWVRPGRRRQTPGRPVTWVTTTEFLDHFGLERIEDLPGMDDLKAAGFLDTRPALHAFRAEDMPGNDGEGSEEEADGPDESEVTAKVED